MNDMLKTFVVTVQMYVNHCVPIVISFLFPLSSSSSTRCVCPGCSLACALGVMKNPGAAESRRLVGLLEDALVREARLWKAPVFKNGCIQVRKVVGTCIKTRCDFCIYSLCISSNDRIISSQGWSDKTERF